MTAVSISSFIFHCHFVYYEKETQISFNLRGENYTAINIKEKMTQISFSLQGKNYTAINIMFTREKVTQLSFSLE